MNEKQSRNDVGLFSMVPVVTGRQESIIILRSGPAYASARNRSQSEEYR